MQKSDTSKNTETRAVLEGAEGRETKTALAIQRPDQRGNGKREEGAEWGVARKKGTDAGP